MIGATEDDVVGDPLYDAEAVQRLHDLNTWAASPSAQRAWPDDPIFNPPQGYNCRCTPMPILTDPRPTARSRAADLGRGAANLLVLALGLTLALAFAALACGGILVDNRVADRAILKWSGR